MFVCVRKVNCPVCGKEVLARGIGLHSLIHDPEYLNAFKNRRHTEKAKCNNSKKHLGKCVALSAEARRKISESKKGRPRPDMIGTGNPAKRPEVRKKISDWLRNAPDEWYRLRFERAALKPNKLELKLEELITTLGLPYEYVGNGWLIIGGKCPDFANFDGQKKLIELFGEYWHKIGDEESRAAHFARYGFRTLVIWESELSDIVAVRGKLLKFNGEKEVMPPCA